MTAVNVVGKPYVFKYIILYPRRTGDMRFYWVIFLIILPYWAGGVEVRNKGDKTRMSEYTADSL